MGIFSRFFRKSNPVGRAIVSLMAGGVAWSDKDYRSLSKNGYKRNPFAYAAVREISQAVGGIPWMLFRVASDGNEQITEHDLLDLLECPNPDMGGGKFFSSLVSYQLIHGNSYAVTIGPDNAPPIELWLLRPDRVTAREGDSLQPISGYEHEIRGIKQIFDRDQVLHLKEFDPLSDFYGMSPLEVASRSIDAINNAKEWNVSLLQNSGRPSGAFRIERELDKQQVDDLREQLEDDIEGYGIQGFRNAGKPIVLQGGMDWTPFSMSAQDMAWLDGQRLSAKEVAIAFNIPPEILGDTESKTYSNFKEARRAFYIENILPRMDALRDELNRWLVPKFGDGLRLDYDKESIEAIQSDRKEMMDLAIGYFQSGLLSKGKALELVGLSVDEEDDSTDLVVLPNNLVPVVDGQPVIQPPSDGQLSARRKGLLTQERKALIWKSFDQERERWNGRVTAEIVKRFDAERKALFARIKNAGSKTQIENAIVQELDRQQKKWSDIIKGVYATVGRPFAEQVQDELGSARASRAAGPFVVKQDHDPWLTELIRYLEDSGLADVKSVQITKTTRDSIIKELGKGIDAGEGTDDLARRIQNKHKDLSLGRAQVIARTEVIAASNVASLASAKATAKEDGFEIKKEWITTIDSRTRDPHASADEQVVGPDDKFEVGGELLDFPGDSANGSAGNVINCRCVVATVPVGDD